MAEAQGKKKKKGTTVSLGSFLGDNAEPKDWADVDDEPEDERDYNRGGDRDDGYSRRNDYGGGRERRRDDYERGSYRDDYRQPREPRPQKEIPARGPWIAYVGNLSFNVTEEKLEEFFSAHCKVVNVRLLTDRETGKPKGYGYVTFVERNDLEMALEANGIEFEGRGLRIDVAEEKADRSSDRGPRREPREVEPSRADLVDKWERGKSQPQPQPQSRSFGDRGNRPSYGDRGNRNFSSERKPLNLKPRSVDAPINSFAETKRSDPFGGAKPRDEVLFQKKKESEWAERGITIKTSAPSERKPRDDKKPAGKGPAETKPESANLYSVLANESK